MYHRFSCGTPTESTFDMGKVARGLHYAVSGCCCGHCCKARRKGLGCRTVIGKREINPSLSVASLIPNVPEKVSLLSGWEEEVEAGIPLICKECQWTAFTQQVWWAEGIWTQGRGWSKKKKKVVSQIVWFSKQGTVRAGFSLESLYF